MQEDAVKWDKKHAQSPMPQMPSDLLVDFLPLLNSKPSKKALDLACGNGRNAKLLAQNGFICDAIDISEVALRSCKDTEGITAICMDLDAFQPMPLTYDVVLDFYFLDRRLFPELKKSLKPKGIFLLETFIHNDDHPPRISEEKILNPGELETIFADYEILHHRISSAKPAEGRIHAQIISFVAQKP